MEWTPLANSSYKGKRFRHKTFFLSFRLDIVVQNFNLVNETYPVKGSQKFKDVQARLMFKLCEASVTSRMVKNVCNMVLLLIAADCFSLLDQRLFSYDSWVLWCKFYSLDFYSINLYITDMVLVLEVSPMVPSIFKES